MSRFLPSPPLSIAVLVLWLLLVAEFSAGQLVLGIALAIALPLVAGALQPERAHVRRTRAVFVLLARVLWDIVLSNIEVARRILGPESALTPTFVWLPLDLTNIHGITTLASIITLTPGTVSAELSEDRRHLLIHCFNLDDAEQLLATIKARYEAPLKEIFP
ncbi:Na+/H+ antiporter subunit E [Cognatilysobacter bugurensis]|uniref:Na+/H+ antiporter subunit E n=1 Tax=Cognatilysobacter bugurensis TaxID=543356 RepID=A0A918WAM1_9GAMM|nr:Na+/H+ antiporter subunit E [Lysobacter bugurensis]GHA85964.1 Na+/H+ antiporter subunit E [Lysobacter bugurensis]